MIIALGIRVWISVSVMDWVRVRIKNSWGLRLSPKIFSCLSYSRTIACCRCLTSNQKVLIYTTHIKKQLPNLISLFWEEKYLTNNNRSEISQKVRSFRTGQKFRRGRLTPGPTEKNRILPESTPALQIDGHLWTVWIWKFCNRSGSEIFW